MPEGGLLPARRGPSGHKMSVMLCRWEQNNFSMKLVGPLSPRRSGREISGRVRGTQLLDYSRLDWIGMDGWVFLIVLVFDGAQMVHLNGPFKHFQNLLVFSVELFLSLSLSPPLPITISPHCFSLCVCIRGSFQSAPRLTGRCRISSAVDSLNICGQEGMRFCRSAPA